MSHGWQFVYDGKGELLDVWFCVSAWNASHRPIHLEHVGFEAIVEGDPKLATDAGVTVPPDQRLATLGSGQRYRLISSQDARHPDP